MLLYMAFQLTSYGLNDDIGAPPPGEAQSICLRPQLPAYSPLSIYPWKNEELLPHSFSYSLTHLSSSFSNLTFLSLPPLKLSALQPIQVNNTCRIMSFAPPSGPPPPSVPEGWTAQYDDRYHAWYVYLLILIKGKLLTTTQVLCRPCHGQIAMGPPRSQFSPTIIQQRRARRSSSNSQCGGPEETHGIKQSL